MDIKIFGKMDILPIQMIPSSSKQSKDLWLVCKMNYFFGSLF
jgi:hypothetical protein